MVQPLTASQSVRLVGVFRAFLAGMLLVPALDCAAAQIGTFAPPSIRQSCDGKTITSINIKSSDPSFDIVPRPLRHLARIAGLHYSTTRTDVVGRFLVVAVGEPCSQRKLVQSEQILRQQDFIADASVRIVADTGDGVGIVVETIDEIPIILHLGVRDGSPAALAIGHGNIGGQGVYLATGVERQRSYRTGFSISASASQMFGHPFNIALAAERAPLGSALTLSLQRAFLADAQRYAWHVGFGDVNAYVPFARIEGDSPALAVQRRFWDIGGVARLGTGARRAFAGALLTYEDVVPESRAVVISDSGLIADTSEALSTPTSPYRNLRLNAVFGVRDLDFAPLRGLNALATVQDIVTGVQIGGLVGRGIPKWGASDDDVFLSADFYAGVGNSISFAALQAEFEGRRDQTSREWDSMIGSTRVAWYVKPSARHLIAVSAGLSGAWRERIPLQLRLGDRDGGVRGYHSSHVAGAVRGIVRIEDRWALGVITTRAALGLAGFVDVGRVWAGDAPFGVTSKTKVALGIGLLGAVPAESRRPWRLDVAVPVSADQHARWEVRFTSIWGRTLWREPRDLARMRAGSAPSAIFAWPGRRI